MSERYDDKYAEMIVFYIVECGLVNRRGQPAWAKIAKAMHRDASTLRRWRNPLDRQYKPAFAEAVQKSVEAVETGQIKRSMIDKAKGFIRKKVVREKSIVDGKMQITKKEQITMAGDVRAAELVLANYGPVEKRWFAKQQIGNIAGEKLEIEINVNEMQSEHQSESEAVPGVQDDRGAGD